MLEIYSDLIKESLYSSVLENGLTVLLMPRNNYSRHYALFATNYGSIDNRFIDPETGKEVVVPEGIAHFLEHKLFAGEKGDAFTEFARLGAMANAFTGFTKTAYLFNGTSNLEESLLNLLDFVQEPYFTPENVEKEKGIIAQEIKMYEDDPDHRVFFNLLQGLYHYHPVRINIAGTVESINRITCEDLYLCYNTFYHPANMVLFLTGNFKPEEILRLIKENQSGKEFPRRKEIKRLYPAEPATISQPLIRQVMDVNQPLIRLGFKDGEPVKDAQEMIKKEIATDMLLELIIGKGTELYQNLYEAGLLDDNFDQYYVRERDYAYVIMGGKTGEPDRLYRDLLSGIESAGNKFREGDFSRILKKYMGDYIEAFNSFEIVAGEFVEYFFKEINFFDIIELIRSTEPGYLYERYERLFRKELSTYTIISG